MINFWRFITILKSLIFIFISVLYFLLLLPSDSSSSYSGPWISFRVNNLWFDLFFVLMIALFIVEVLLIIYSVRLKIKLKGIWIKSLILTISECIILSILALISVQTPLNSDSTQQALGYGTSQGSDYFTILLVIIILTIGGLWSYLLYKNKKYYL